MKNLKVASLLHFLANIRLGWKCLPGISTLVNYYDNSKIADVKRFVTLGPEVAPSG
jgi:hypothetical protein